MYLRELRFAFIKRDSCVIHGASEHTGSFNGASPNALETIGFVRLAVEDLCVFMCLCEREGGGRGRERSERLW